MVRPGCRLPESGQLDQWVLGGRLGTHQPGNADKTEKGPLARLL
ncbi:hypothetical protein GCM10027186_36000 [Micromonospora schwarzwaldensis]